LGFGGYEDLQELSKMFKTFKELQRNSLRDSHNNHSIRRTNPRFRSAVAILQLLSLFILALKLQIINFHVVVLANVFLKFKFQFRQNQPNHRKSHDILTFVSLWKRLSFSKLKWENCILILFPFDTTMVHTQCMLFG
jgi:hypothetical protein